MTEYTFFLETDNLTIVVVDEWGPLNTWKALPGSCLVIDNGIVDAVDRGFICHSGPPDNEAVVCLWGARWDSKTGISGEAEVRVSQGCSERQRWSLQKVK